MVLVGHMHLPLPAGSWWSASRRRARQIVQHARAIAYEKFGRWFDAEEPLLRAKERTDAGSSPFRHPRSELIAPLLQEAPSAFNNRKLHMRLPWRHGGDGILIGTQIYTVGSTA